jgi:transcriptional regulator with GAF, ATPase, and Fis domain/serine/threonine protein kinase/tetratricopeptide (TPR) repeat protein
MKILDYQFKERIGRGGFSEVYRAEKDGRVFAVKILNAPAGTKAEDLLARMRYEFWVLKDLDHPHIAKVRDFGCLEDGRVFLVEDFIAGVTLKDFCSDRPFAECEPVLVGLLRGLKSLHEWNIVHGDLKTDNVLVAEGADGAIAKILDFGLSRHLLGSDSPIGDGFAGTPATAAPELLLEHKVDRASDLYAVGVTFYEALSGFNPFVGGTAEETFHRHLTLHPEPVALLRRDVPPHWGELIGKLLAKNPSDRPGSVARVLFELKKDGEAFTLVPTAIIGRERELELVPRLITSLKNGESLAVSIWGENGAGVKRLLKEFFYRIIAIHPEFRDRITLSGAAPGETHPLLLLNRVKAPPSHRALTIRLEPFSVHDVTAWCELLFGMTRIPREFAERLTRLGCGLPGRMWEILTRWNEEGRLIDAAGRVSKATLEMIAADDSLPSPAAGDAPPRDFAIVLELIQAKLYKRALKADDPLFDEADSLNENEPNAHERLSRRAILSSLKGAAHIEEGRFDEAREILRSSLTLFQEAPELAVERIRAQNYLAYVSLRQGRGGEAVELFEKSRREMHDDLRPEDAIQIANLDLGLAYLETGRLKDAAEALDEERRRHKESGRDSRTLFCLYNLAKAHQGLGDMSRAENEFHEVVSLARKTRELTYLLRGYNGLGNVLERSGRRSECLNAYDEAFELALALKDHRSAAAAAQNRGAVKAALGLHDEAREDLDLSYRYAEGVKPRYAYEKNLMCRALIELGSLDLNRGRPEDAKSNLDRAWHQAEHDADLAGLKFWILAARIRLWITVKNRTRLKNDLAQIRFFAAGEEQNKIVSELEAESSRLSDESAGAEATRLEGELATILKINRDLTGEMPLGELLKRILGFAIELSKSELGVMLTADKDGRLTPNLSLNADLTGDLSEISLSVAEKALATGEAVRAHDAAGDTEYNQYASVMNLKLKSILGVPILFHGEAMGVLYLSHRRRTGLFDEKTVRVVSAFADQAALALKNRELLDHYRRTAEEMETELESTKLSLARAREKLKASAGRFEIKLGKVSLITKSPRMMEILSQAERLAASSVTILIHGPSGSGKELLARYLHESSPRKDGAFVAVNCGALPQNLVESELFGHKKGAFTGADQDRAGLIEAAGGGTLFLDEVADLPQAVQVKLLRVLQERELVRVGETRPRAVDVRVLAASHVPLKEAVRRKEFREDLYYRLAGMELTLPGLCERREDIPLLAEDFLKSATAELGKTGPSRIAPALLKKMLRYDWPGNIRELRNLIEVGASLSDKAVLSEVDLPDYALERMESNPSRGAKASGSVAAVGWYHPRKTWKEHELLIYASALDTLDFDIARAAASLGVSVATVYKWMRDHRLRDAREQLASETLPYEEGLKLEGIKSFVFRQVLSKHPGHPYRAAKELDVAPATVYRYAGK